MSSSLQAWMTMNQILAGDFDAEPLFENTTINNPIPIGSLLIIIIRLFICMSFTNILIVVVLERYQTAKSESKNVHPHFSLAMTNIAKQMLKNKYR
jgi:hypothetical protein